MIRAATPADIPALVELSIEALSIDPYPQLVLDRNRVYQRVRECVISQRNFSWVSVQGGEVVGGLGALVTPQGFYEGNVAMVLMWYCKRRPGDGFRLLRKFLAWVDAQPGINTVEYTGERGADPRIAAFLQRAGFGERLPVYLRMKTGSARQEVCHQ